MEKIANEYWCRSRAAEELQDRQMKIVFQVQSTLIYNLNKWGYGYDALLLWIEKSE